MKKAAGRNSLLSKDTEKDWKLRSICMIDLQDKSYCPTLEELGGGYIKNPVFLQFWFDKVKI